MKIRTYLIKLISIIIFIYLCNFFVSITYSQNTKSVKLLKKYAERYRPKGQPNQGPEILPELKKKYIEAINEACIIDSIKSEKYITLILLRLYRAHLECCNQSYELRKNKKFIIDSLQTPILFTFIKLTKMYPLDRKIEFIPSSIAFKWVGKNPNLLSYQPIKIEIERIEKRKKLIEHGKI